MENYKILITGGHGFIGCHISHILKKLGHTVGVIDNYTDYKYYDIKLYRKVLAQRIKYARVDNVYLRDILKCETVFESFKPDIVIHLASCPNANMLLGNIAQETKTAITGTLKIL